MSILDQTAGVAKPDSLFTIGRFLETCDEAGYNMMHAAIIHKRLDVIEKLFDCGTCKRGITYSCS